MIESLFQSSGSWSEQLSVGLLIFAVRATLILLAAFLVTRLIRGTSAATRHLVWTAAVAGVLVLPLLSAVLPSWNVPVVTIRAKLDAPIDAALGSEVRPQSVAAERNAPTATPAPIVAPASVSAPLHQTQASWFQGLTTTTLVASVWLAVASLLLLRLGVANARVSGWKRASSIVEDGRWNALMRRLTRDYDIERPVVLLQSEETDVPVTWGVVYPVVLIPGSADDWDEEQRIAVLTHELAHVKRFDALSQMLGQVSLALLWFHPLAWMAVRRMRQEREHACDDFVLAAGARASRYADDLLGLARRLTRPTAPAAAALAMARRSELEGRLLAILDPAIKRGSVEKGRVGLLTMLLLFCVIPLSAFQPAARVTMASPTTGKPVVQVKALVPQSSVTPSPQKRQDAEPKAAQDSSRSEMDALIARLDNVQPSLTSLSVRAPSLSRFRADTEPVLQGQGQQPVDVAMLVEVARAAKKMTSDYEKGQLLTAVAKRYVRNDSLRDAYLDAVFTMTSDYERSKALVLLLERDSIPSYSTAKVLRSAKGMTSDASRGIVLKSISPTTFADTSVQRAYMEVITAMTSDFERSQAISALIKTPQLSQSVQLGVLRATTAISTNNDKANVLLLFVSKQGLADESVRRAFMKSAETLSSDYDYRRVMTAVMK
jgi:beta-lactamase regulating signal transducer with metallopeptidase domain